MRFAGTGTRAACTTKHHRISVVLVTSIPFILEEGVVWSGPLFEDRFESQLPNANRRQAKGFIIQ